MQFQKLAFKNADGKSLAARLDLPVDEKPMAYALFAHCFTCTKHLNAVVNISRALTRCGIAVLRFDFTGLGESEGDFSETNFSSNVADLVAASRFLSTEYEAPKILVGHSLGGAAVLRAASGIPSSVAVAVIGAPADPSHITRYVRAAGSGSAAGDAIDVALMGKTVRLKKQFLEDVEGVRMREVIRGLDKALLIMHSPVDEIVSVQNAAEIFQAARHPKSFVSLDKADHLLSNRSDSQYAGLVLAAWAQKYIAPVPEGGESGELQDNRVVATIGASGYQTEIRVRGHSLIADEPIAQGGSDTGPTPYDYLVAALGACTSMTLRMYADRKKWPLESVVVRLRHERIHASDCDACTTKEGKVDRIEREIELVGPLSEEQRAAFLGIADKCPVHRTLHSEIVVDTRLKERDASGGAHSG